MFYKLLVATESIVGLIASFMVGFFPTIILFFGGVALLFDRQWDPGCVCLMGSIVSGILAGHVARLASRVIDRQGSVFPPDPDFPDASNLDHERFSIEEPPPPPRAIPFAMAMAGELPDWPLLIRAFASLWWVAHFALAAVAGHASARALAGHLNNPKDVTVIFVGIGLRFAFLFAANLYLLLAVAVMVPRRDTWRALWHYRFVIDLMLALGSLLVPKFL